jgi:hypothetical protein
MASLAGDANTVGEVGVLGTFVGDPEIEDMRNYAGGVLGRAVGQPGVWGLSNGGPGVLGQVEGNNSPGVYGRSDPDDNDTSGIGVFGTGAVGVQGQGTTGVFGQSWMGNGVLGLSHHPVNAAVSAVNDAGGLGLWVESRGPQRKAAHFEGNIEVVGTVTVSSDLAVTGDVFLKNRDLAERFELASDAESVPGTVMVMHADGAAAPCARDYDKRALGVISGAGTLRPAITLGVEPSATRAAPIALLGTAFCLVDADRAAVEVGDLLTCSGTRGHAMKAVDASRSFGAVIGKALAPLPSGRGLVPIIVSLQ